jgi:hypothetical protein
MQDNQTKTVTESVRATVGSDVTAYISGEPPPTLFAYRHTWPFDDPQAENLDLTPSQHSMLVRSAFTELLPNGLTSDERHEAWHRFLLTHPTIWPACHGGFTNRMGGSHVLLGLGW